MALIDPLQQIPAMAQYLIRSPNVGLAKGIVCLIAHSRYVRKAHESS